MKKYLLKPQSIDLHYTREQSELSLPIRKSDRLASCPRPL
jgi:hypothetical protein